MKTRIQNSLPDRDVERQIDDQDKQALPPHTQVVELEDSNNEFKQQLRLAYAEVDLSALMGENGEIRPEFTHVDVEAAADDEEEIAMDWRLPSIEEFNQLSDIYSNAEKDGVLEELLKRFKQRWGNYQERPSVEEIKRFYYELRGEKKTILFNNFLNVNEHRVEWIQYVDEEIVADILFEADRDGTGDELEKILDDCAMWGWEISDSEELRVLPKIIKQAKEDNVWEMFYDIYESYLDSARCIGEAYSLTILNVVSDVLLRVVKDETFEYFKKLVCEYLDIQEHPLSLEMLRVLPDALVEVQKSGAFEVLKRVLVESLATAEELISVISVYVKAWTDGILEAFIVRCKVHGEHSGKGPNVDEAKHLYQELSENMRDRDEKLEQIYAEAEKEGLHEELHKRLILKYPDDFKMVLNLAKTRDIYKNIKEEVKKEMVESFLTTCQQKAKHPPNDAVVKVLGDVLLRAKSNNNHVLLGDFLCFCLKGSERTPAPVIVQELPEMIEQVKQKNLYGLFCIILCACLKASGSTPSLENVRLFPELLYKIQKDDTFDIFKKLLFACGNKAKSFPGKEIMEILPDVLKSSKQNKVDDLFIHVLSGCLEMSQTTPSVQIVQMLPEVLVRVQKNETADLFKDFISHCAKTTKRLPATEIVDTLPEILQKCRNPTTMSLLKDLFSHCLTVSKSTPAVESMSILPDVLLTSYRNHTYELLKDLISYGLKDSAKIPGVQVLQNLPVLLEKYKSNKTCFEYFREIVADCLRMMEATPDADVLDGFFGIFHEIKDEDTFRVLQSLLHGHWQTEKTTEKTFPARDTLKMIYNALKSKNKAVDRMKKVPFFVNPSSCRAAALLSGIGGVAGLEGGDGRYLEGTI